MDNSVPIPLLTMPGITDPFAAPIWPSNCQEDDLTSFIASLSSHKLRTYE
jgi:hypothetical protein